MLNTQFRFEEDPGLDQIEILIRAPKRDEQVEAILKQLSASPQKTLTVFDRLENKRILPAEEIVSASVHGKQVHIVTQNGRFYLKQTISYLESVLDPRQFVRISRYEIVNLSKVVSFDFTLAGTLRLELSGGMETWASRRCIPAIRKRLLGKE